MFSWDENCGRFAQNICFCGPAYLLTYAHRSQWSIGHQRPPAIALCSGLLLSFRTSWSPAVSALIQCLASNCCEAGLSSSSLAGSRSGLGVWCWMLASWGCVRSSPTSSAVSAWPLVPVPLAPTVLHFGSSLAIGFCRCASDRCWRMSGSFVASSVLSAMSHIRKTGLTSHWSWRCGVWFSRWFLQMPRCFWAWQKLLLPCRFWLWRLGLCLPDGQPHFPDRRRTPPPLWALHQLWLVRWQLCSSSSAQSSFCWSWALSPLMWSPGEWSCTASGCDCVTGAPGHQRSRGRLAASRVSTVYRCSYLLLWSSWSSRWPGERGTVKVGTPAGLQSPPQNFQTAGRRGQFCSSCPGRCTGRGRLSSWGLHSVSVASMFCGPEMHKIVKAGKNLREGETHIFAINLWKVLTKSVSHFSSTSSTALAETSTPFVDYLTSQQYSISLKLALLQPKALLLW